MCVRIQYWYNPTTSETSWDEPTTASPAAPAPEDIVGASTATEDIVGSKQQQLALLLANNEARAAAREQKQVQDKAERAAKAFADRAERSARQAQASLSSSRSDPSPHALAGSHARREGGRRGKCEREREREGEWKGDKERERKRESEGNGGSFCSPAAGWCVGG